MLSYHHSVMAPDPTPAIPGSSRGPGFPDEHALCESCGYPLKGLGYDGDCPECGEPIAGSDPVHRTGLPWQHRRTPGTLAHTALAVLLAPSRSSRRLRLDREPLRDAAAFMVLHLVLVAGVAVLVSLFALFYAVFGGYEHNLLTPEARHFLALSIQRESWAMLVPAAVCVAVVPAAIILSLIESLGVTIVCKRRGWRVPWRRAFAVCCYASVGWWLTAAVWVAVILTYHHGRWLHDWLDTLYPWRDVVEAGGLILLVGISLLPFEALVWTGVRAVRYGNEAVRVGPANRDQRTASV